MLTVVLACDASGNSSTRRPLARPYSVMPSTDGPWLTPGGSAACALQPKARKKTAANTRLIECERAIMEMWSGERRRLYERPEKRGEWAMDLRLRLKFGSGVDLPGEHLRAKRRDTPVAVPHS